ncbi:MAG TPA: DUF374 domain-containing protein [Myxococcota bacterium]|nr:DUF374 domain-containing protein [Myxococcota bacterium]
MGLALFVVPLLYLLYMRLVYATSRVRVNDFLRLHDVIREYDGAVGLLWHEEVFTVAYGYPHLGFRPHTLASLGRMGELITRLLLRCGFVVFRGGSSSKPSRRRADVVADLIEHMRAHHEVIYGLTVDGAQGPPYRMKRGGVVVARECRKPVVLVRTWYRRCLRLPTWDRTAIPLPGNEIVYFLAGPYPVPDDAASEAGLARFVLELEDALIALALRSYTEMGQSPPAALRKRSPEEREAWLRGAAVPAYAPAEGISPTGDLRDTTAQSSTSR